MERPTNTINIQGYQVVLYTYLSIGELRIIQKELVGSKKIKATDTDVADLEDFDMGDLLDQQDQAMEFLVKEVKTEEGEVVLNPQSFIFQLDPKDGQALYDEVNRIFQESSLSSVDKKK